MEDIEADLFGVDEEDKPNAEAASQSQTQVAVKGFLSDIFGDDDDDEAGAIKGSGGGKGDSDEEFNDSSDDDVTSRKRNKLGGKKKVKAKEPKNKKAKKSKKEDKEKGKKRKPVEVATASGRISKKPTAPKERDPNAAAGADDGDAYDSEEDAVATREDRQFLADEDDNELAGVLREYDDDDQNFDDERPRKKSKGGGGGGGSTKELDPFSETLKAMKKPKAVEINDTEKNKIANDLLQKMDQAAIKDQVMCSKGEPAVNKLNLLPAVQSVVSTRSMQATLLDYDILRAFSTWLQPLPDKSLPSLTLRSAVYEMLVKLPCQSDHLKRTDPNTKQTIGMLVISLIKSKLETEENKRKLRALVERWARPIFGKQTDVRSANFEENAEIRAVSIATTHQRLSAATEADRKSSSATSVDVFDAGAKKVDPNKRVRTPYSTGFLYTVQPDAFVVEKLDQSASLGGSRQGLVKKLKDTKATAYGKKSNPRAMDMAMSGRNKS